MVKLRTAIELAPSTLAINYADHIVSLGSCFAQHVAERLERMYYPISVNPFGVLYNPLSIRNSLGLLLNNYTFEQADLFEHKGIWSSFQHHSSFSGTDPAAVVDGINESLEVARTHLRSADLLILTFGTAWVYELKLTHKVVSNCHQVPAKKFHRRRLDVAEITKAMGALFDYLKEQRPDLDILLTVSPVRHLKDGFVENQLSKATLLLAVNELEKSADYVHYFPAYEMVMDDLRDYRFYKKDLVHLNDLAVDCIWSVFGEQYLAVEEADLRKQLQKLNKAIGHRPSHPTSAVHQQFVQKQLEKVKQLEKEHQMLNLAPARKLLKEQLL